MPANRSASAVVKKVQPYPISALLEIGPAKSGVEIIYLTDQACLARLVNKEILNVGAYHKIAFAIPVMGHTIEVNTRVVRTFDKAIDAKSVKVERMVELRFEALGKEQQKYVLSFLSAIGQK